MEAAEFLSLSRSTRAQHLRGLAAEAKAARAELRQHKQDRKGRVREVRARCKEARKAVKQSIKQRRAALLLEFKALAQREREAVNAACSLELDQVKRSAASALERATAQRRALEKKRQQLRNLSGDQRRAQAAYLRRKERESEQDDFVAADLDADVPGLGDFFREHARSIFAPSRTPEKMSRREHVLHWLEEHADTFEDWQSNKADRYVSEVERREREAYEERERLAAADALEKARKKGKKGGKGCRTCHLEDAPF